MTWEFAARPEAEFPSGANIYAELVEELAPAAYDHRQSTGDTRPLDRRDPTLWIAIVAFAMMFVILGAFATYLSMGDVASDLLRQVIRFW